MKKSIIYMLLITASVMFFWFVIFAKIICKRAEAQTQTGCIIRLEREQRILLITVRKR
mgnify:CR=1 FL=1